MISINFQAIESEDRIKNESDSRFFHCTQTGQSDMVTKPGEF